MKDKFDAYLKLTAWARNRYVKNQYLIVAVGDSPSIYTRIERAAWFKYLYTNCFDA